MFDKWLVDDNIVMIIEFILYVYRLYLYVCNELQGVHLHMYIQTHIDQTANLVMFMNILYLLFG